jgi:hypothetical protein
MIQKLLPVLLALIGVGAGIGGGIALRPDPEIVMIDPCGDVEGMSHEEADEEEMDEELDATFEYVKLNNQFVIPDLDDGKVTAMLVLSLSLETKVGSREAVYAIEPKLRDAFLQVLFDHANMGGFKGAFTSNSTMSTLRLALTEVAQTLLNKDIKNVLVTDIVRQDL